MFRTESVIDGETFSIDQGANFEDVKATARASLGMGCSDFRVFVSGAYRRDVTMVVLQDARSKLAAAGHKL